MTRVFILSWLLFITGCGFTPLYTSGAGSASPQVSAALQTISVAQIPDRSGQRLRWLLLESLSQANDVKNPAYVLAVSLEERRSYLGIRPDATSSYGKVAITARYTLTRAGESKPIFTDKTRSLIGYDVVDSEYASLKAEEDAREKTLRQLAQRITYRLARYLEQAPNPTQP